MNVNRQVREWAILRVFDALNATDGRALPLRDLMTVWRETGLRSKDLERGLEEMSRARLVRVQMSADGPQAWLTAAGVEQAGHPRNHLNALISELTANSVLIRARRRQREGDRGQRRRREDAESAIGPQGSADSPDPPRSA